MFLFNFILCDNQLDASDKATITIAAFAAVASIIVCIVTCINCIQQRRHNQSETLMDIASEYRNMLVSLMGNDELYNATIKNQKDMTPENIASGFFINHANCLHYYYTRGLIESNEWESIKTDIDEIFHIKNVIVKWANVRQYYSKRFRIFIEEEIMPNLNIEEVNEVISPHKAKNCRYNYCCMKKCIRNINKHK